MMAPPKLPVKPMRPKPPKKPRRLGNSLSIVVPTPGRGRPLEDTLRSVQHQRAPGDEILVCHDTVDGADPEVRRLCVWYGCRYLEVNPGYHDWGHTQARVGTEAAEGDWIVGNDDDDIFMPDAFALIRAAIAEQPYPRPLFFQFMTPWRQVLWAEPVLQEGRVGGHMLCQPNVPGKLAFMTSRYSGDFDMLVKASELYGGDVAWVPKVIAWTRPTADELARLVPEGVAV